MKPKLWITYAWADDKDGDFSHLVQELGKVGIEAQFDRISLVHGRGLWTQIADRISEGELDGWAYLLTKSSLASRPCGEELAYALDRALQSRNREFPLIGLLHGVSITDLPAPLRVRLCVNLADSNWRESILSSLEGRPPSLLGESTSPYVWNIHIPYTHIPESTAIEFRPRFGEIMYWRISVPLGTKVSSWGHGPAGGKAIAMFQTIVVSGGDGEVNGRKFIWFGGGDRLSPTTSAYVVFNGNPPELVGFGDANEPMGPPNPMEFRYISSLKS